MIDKLKTYSLVKQSGSPYFFACWRNENGRQFKRSTKVPYAGGEFQGRKLNKQQAARLAEQVAVRLMAEQVEQAAESKNISVRKVCNLMLSGKLGKVSPQTYKNARVSYAIFLKWLGRRADEPIRNISRAMLKEWIMARRADVRCNTCKKDLGAVNAALSWALDAEYIDRHPGQGLRVPADTKAEKTLHEAFSLDEVRYLVDKLPDEWSSAVRCCIGTFGQRLSDILALKWEQFDWQNRCVRIVTAKTARALVQPMTDSFLDWARARYEAAQDKGGDCAVWVHPNLRLNSNASGEFSTLVKMHGIGVSSGAPGGKRKSWHSKTFHSLRASVATMLQLGGVSQGVAMHLVGHDSADVHSVYIRPTTAQLLDAASNFPSI